MNNLVEFRIPDILRSDLEKLLGTDELRDLNGKRLRKITAAPFYLSIEVLSTHSTMKLHTRVISLLMKDIEEDCCIARLTSNISYILLKIEDDRASIVKRSELTEEEKKLYEARCR